MKNKVYINEKTKQYKGNFHQHSTRSDGHASIETVIEVFKNAGYNFCLVSDHETYWDSTEFDDENFITLSGAECSIRENPNKMFQLGRETRSCIHLNIFFDERLRGKVEPFKHDEFIQPLIDNGYTSWEKRIEFLKSKGNMVILNHPRWSRLEPEMMIAINGCFATEVYNHTSETVESTGESEYEWDYCLRKGKRLFGIGADDCHSYEETDNQALGGWTNVLCESLTRENIAAAMEEGSFYASTGPEIYDLRIEDGYLKMKFSKAQAVRLVAAPGFAPTIWAKPNSEFLTEIKWQVANDIIFVRAEVIGLDGKKAWSQPIFIEDIID